MDPADPLDPIRKAIAVLTALADHDQDTTVDAVLSDYTGHHSAAVTTLQQLSALGPLPDQHFQIIKAALAQADHARDELGELLAGLADVARYLVLTLARISDATEHEVLAMLVRCRLGPSAGSDW